MPPRDLVFTAAAAVVVDWLCFVLNIVIIALDEMHSSAVLGVLVFFFAKSRLELVRVWRETSRHQLRRHPSRRSLAQTERLLFCLGKPRTKGTRFALARLLNTID